MIGQKKLLDKFKEMIENNSLPHFLILVGESGSGKKTLVKEISKMMKDTLVIEAGISVNDVRSMVENSHKLVNRSLYVISDADTMSAPAKNAFLKVTEEPPNDAYYILTLCDKNNTLPTILSRGTVFYMNNYTSQEILEYVGDRGKKELQIIKELCTTPGDVEQLKKTDIEEFYSYVEKVIDNIAEVEIFNAFKISEKIAFKDEEDLYNLKLFLRAFMFICMNRMKQEEYEDSYIKYSSGLVVTSRHLQQLGIRGINKSTLFDSWIIQIRKAWVK